MIAEGEISHEKITEVRQEQNKLAKKLQTALSALQVQVFERVQELAPELSTEVLQRIAQVTAQLQADLVAVTGIRVAVQAPHESIDESVKAIESVEAHSADATSELATAAAGSESTILEQTGVVDQLSSSEQLVVTTETLVKTIAETKEVVTSEEVKPISVETVTANIVPETEQTLAVEGIEAVVIEQTESVAVKEVPKEDAKLNVSEADQVQEVTITEPLKTESVSAVVVEDLGPELHEVDENKLADDGPTQTAEIHEAPKATIEMLVQHIDQFISDDLTEVINELSNVIDVEELKQSIGIAKELRENIIASEVELKAETSDVLKDEVSTQYANLAQKLYEALSALENISLETAAEGTLINKDALQRVTAITENLRADLVAVTATQYILDQTRDAKPDQSNTNVAQVEVPEFEAGEVTSIEKEVLTASSEVAAEFILIEDKAAIAEGQQLIQETGIQEKGKGDNTEIAAPNEINELDKAMAVTDGEPIFEKAVPSEVKAVSVEQAAIIMEEPLEKVTTETLLQNINEFLSDENIKTIDQISAIVTVDELKQSVDVACDLRENIEKINENITSDNIDNLLKLQNALSVVQVISLDATNELSLVVEKDKLERVIASGTDLASAIAVVISQVPKQQYSSEDHVIVEETTVANTATANEKDISKQDKSLESVVPEEQLKNAGEVEVQTDAKITDILNESVEESQQTLKEAESIDKSIILHSNANEEQSKDSESGVTEHIEVIHDKLMQKGEISKELSELSVMINETKSIEDKSGLIPKVININTENSTSTQAENATEIGIPEATEQVVVITNEEEKPAEVLSNVTLPEQFVTVGIRNTVCAEEDKTIQINKEHVDEAVLQQEITNERKEIGEAQPSIEDNKLIDSITEQVVKEAKGPIEQISEPEKLEQYIIDMSKPSESIEETKQKEEKADSTKMSHKQPDDSSKIVEKSESTEAIPASAIETSKILEQTDIDKLLQLMLKINKLRVTQFRKQLVKLLK
ncbi:unnamed protein product [Spodoptera littoralis]|uniref:Uncharacterized protein n=1 Tax=Spodoptera littoralis TaxID=7109 RepID=A0A9P0NAH4_SPOLI|nr:unnamed protein product [Spodoptera littoralis]CAH1647412.1 unnamed protein product [Spodoptera littoralis]